MAAERVRQGKTREACGWDLNGKFMQFYVL